MTAKSNHPSYLEMFCEAVAHLNERKGSSRQAVTKWMIETYDLEASTAAMSSHLKKAIQTAIRENKIVEVSDRPGLNGKWKVVKEKSKSKSKTSSKSSDKTVSISPKNPASKKTTTAKKTSSSSKKTAPKSPKAAAVKLPKKSSAKKSPKSKTASKKKSG